MKNNPPTNVEKSPIIVADPTIGQRLHEQRGPQPQTTGQTIQAARDAGKSKPHASVVATTPTTEGISGAYDAMADRAGE